MTDVMSEQQPVDLDELSSGEPAGTDGLNAVDEQLIARLAGRAREGGLALTGEGGLLAKLTKRNVDVRFIDRSAKIEKIGGDKVKQLIVVKSGIGAETAKKLQTAIKQSKLKVQASIQGDTVRVAGAKRDDLQAAMALIRKEIADQPLSFNNFRD